MIRNLIAAILLSAVMPATAQNVLYLQNGVQLTITPGAEITLQGGLQAESGSSILNNGSLFLTNNSLGNLSNWTDDNAAGIFAAGSDNGTVYLQSINGHIISGNTVFSSLVLDAAGGATLSNSISIAGNIFFKKGRLNTGIYKLMVVNSAASAIQADVANTGYNNSWVNGNLQRSILPNTATYDFPVGNSSQSHLLAFFNNNITGPASLTASFGPKPGTDEGLTATENGTAYTAVNDGGVWYLNAGNAVTGGNYALQLYFNGFAGLTDNQFGILDRAGASSNAADWAVPVESTLEAVNGAGRKVSDGYARRNNMTTFSQLGIGMTAEVLPVAFIHFFAVRQTSTSVKLGWSTATEINNKGFEIERRLESESQFSHNGFVASKAAGGSSQSLLNYTYYDTNPFAGISYYRIKQTDLDDHFMYTAVKAVKGAGSTTIHVTVMPNPSGGQFNIFVNGVLQHYQAFITDTNGKLVRQLTIKSQQLVSVQGLPAATYILTIQNAFGKADRFSEKIIIIH